MIIGIFSDIHDNIGNLSKAKAAFVDKKVELSLFAGDLTSPFTLKYLKDWPTPIKAVFGNNDGDKWGINRRFGKYDLKHIEYGPKNGIYLEIEMEEGKIALFHGDISKFVDLLISSQEFMLVCTGHTHEPHIKTIGKTVWVNPGSVTGVSENPEVKQGTVAVFNTQTKECELIYL